jgi:electron transport complex protein RnfB
MLAAILSLGAIGLIAAVALGFAAKKFAVEVDPRELAILEVLPAVNCGACGYPGCAGYAKALAEGKADPSQCPPGGAGVAEKIANILGVEVVFAEPEVAVVMCQGDNQKALNKFHYLGLIDCSAAQKLAGGPKVCPAGCLGLGSCARACPFGAIEMTGQNLAVINREKCTGCRQCVPVCPRQVIHMAPLVTPVHVLCNSHDKGAKVRKYCQVGCISCHICEKTVPGAYHIENFLARVVYENSSEAAAAVAKCPTHCIRDFTEGYPEGSSFAAAIVPVKSDAA